MDYKKILDNIDSYRRIDCDNILESLANFPNQCARGILLSNISIPKPEYYVDKIYICGLGGSALGGDIVKNFARSRSNIPIEVIRNYSLPDNIDHHSMIFLVSYSGDTEETISCYHEAIELTRSIFILTSGGKLKDEGQKDGHIIFDIPKGYQPRMSTIYLLMPILLTLKELSLIQLTDIEIIRLYMNLEDTKNKLSTSVLYDDNPAKIMAGELYDYVPIIWGTTGLNDVIAKGWKAQINENAKTMAFYNSLPEANHNEIMGTIYPMDILPKVALIFLRDEDENCRISKRFAITSLLMGDKVGKVLEHNSQGDNLLSRLVCQLYFGDYVSYYLAILNGVNPTPVDLIGNLKRHLN